MRSLRSVFVALSVFLVTASCAAHDAAEGAVGTGTDSTHPPTPTTASSHDWTRFGWNAARTSVSTDSTGINAGNVASLSLQKVAIDGTVDGSAIYLHGVQAGGATHNVFFVTTTYGKTLAIDADAGTVLWRFTPPDYGSFAGSYRVTTATPVAALDRQSIYAASPDGSIRQLSVADGHVLWTTSITNLPAREKLASPLNLDRGHVIAVTGGYIGDEPPYQGHVAIIDASTGQLLHVWNSLCSDRTGLIDPKSCGESDSAIWGRAGAVIDTTTGNIFVATGNARWNGSTHWGDAVLELNSDATQLLGNYTPSNTDALNASDADLGSTSPVLLDNGVVAQGGKDGKIRLLTWPSMRGTTGHKGAESEMVSTPSGDRLFTAPAVMRSGSATWLFAADNGGTTAWTVSGGHLTSVWHNGNGGTSPLVAAGLLYVYDPGGHLRVYDPTTGRALATLDVGAGHWNSPIVVDGKIALPEGNSNDHRTSGVFNIFRLPTTP
ncbi:MAG TPA: PQQ-binding-like beta-propeller repeat protein [Gemmatimonadaceae bacterium]|nr:PQQ-binding-like beta-propeller repeat protein [Gemmatimonadaceae bacterium]